MPDPAAAHRCGTVAILGRPNVGKSTLLNALVGARISITSRKPQTTRHRVSGIRTENAAQFVFVDTPGFQSEHRGTMNDRLNRTVIRALGEVDAVVVVVEAGRITDADRAVIALLPSRIPAIAAINKIDRLADRAEMLPQIAALAKLSAWIAQIPVSAEKGDGLPDLCATIAPLLPVGPPQYEADDLTDRDERFLAAEFIREKIFRLLGEELPYATTVVIERFALVGSLRRIDAVVLVAKASQRAIVLGEGGARVKEIGTRARHDMEQLFGGRVYLSIHVRVKAGWAEDPAMLSRLGI